MTDQAEKQTFWEEHGLPAPGTRMTAADYFDLPETTVYMELIDGIVVYPHWNEDTMAPAPTPDHQDVIGNVYVVLRTHAKQRGGTAHIAPLDVVLSDVLTVQPDVMWRAPDSQCKRTDKRFHGAPELVVEILSPSTAKFDRQEKYHAYEQHGVGEYWIVDPVHETVEVWTLKDDTFTRQGAFAGEDTFKSATLDATVNVKAIFEV